ncbi:hypothetical protein [Litorisediminicola beolgyonensis]|uniref:Uncharacterized protein n=1 Tax=Litorisediminicola beolgyonensis TaxID=1173614 RepID=A0ABW3ZII9_9RHOB
MPFNLTIETEAELAARDAVGFSIAVKAEAGRRILALCPEWKQRNLTAQASILAEKGRATWSPEEQAAWDDGEALWTQIAAIRTRSNEIEAMDPPPADPTDDALWP